MNWRYFLGAAILAGGVLLRVGAPLAAVAAGIALAAILNWRMELRARK